MKKNYDKITLLKTAAICTDGKKYSKLKLNYFAVKCQTD